MLLPFLYNDYFILTTFFLKGQWYSLTFWFRLESVNECDNLSLNHYASIYGDREPNLRPSASELLQVFCIFSPSFPDLYNIQL